MTSQLNVDTIVDKAGSGGTNVKVGNTSTYVSDGGSATQNTVQGLCKAWAAVANNKASLSDSFNMSSVDDDGTGDYGLNFTNPFNNQYYCTPIGIRGGITAGNSDGHFAEVETANTTSAECENWYGDAGTNATFTDWECRHTFFGDLA